MRNGISGPQRASLIACSAPVWQQTKKKGDDSVDLGDSISSVVSPIEGEEGWEGVDDGNGGENK